MRRRRSSLCAAVILRLVRSVCVRGMDESRTTRNKKTCWSPVPDHVDAGSDPVPSMNILETPSYEMHESPSSHRVIGSGPTGQDEAKQASVMDTLKTVGIASTRLCQEGLVHITCACGAGLIGGAWKRSQLSTKNMWVIDIP